MLTHIERLLLKFEPMSPTSIGIIEESVFSIKELPY